jgi:alanine dehydrogenase
MLSKAEVSRHLVMQEMVDQMETGFLKFEQGTLDMPQRVRLTLGDGAGYGAFMPCHMPGVGWGIKINTNFRDNTRRGLPRILGLYVLLDTETGTPLAIMDSTAITAHRTAAVSALAMRYLARPEAAVLGVLGTGVLSIPHMLAAASVRQVRRVLAYSPNLERRRDEFLREACASVNVPVEIGRTPQEVVAQADILVVCTSSSEPVLDGRWIRPGTCVIAVGNATPTNRELDTTTVMRAFIVCDSLAACMRECGDFLIPLKEGTITDARVQHELAEVIRTSHAVKEAVRDIVLFKSVGLAFEDLIAARHVYHNAVAAGVNTSFDFFGAAGATAVN